MSAVGMLSSHSFARRKPAYRVIIAQGENVRSFTLKPWLIATIGGVTLVFALLYLSATGYLVFRDDLLAASIASKSRMQHEYEDRIASLRSDIDRLTSRQLLNQEAVEAEMDRLAGRQAALDARQDSIAGLSQAAKRAGIDPTDIPQTAIAAPDVTDDNENSLPADSELDKDPQKTSSIEPVRAGVAPFAFASLRASTTDDGGSDPHAELKVVTASLDALSRDQVAYVDTIASRVSQKADRIAGILQKLGQRVPPSHAATTDVGGPLVEIDEDADPDTFRSSVDLITGEIDRFGAIRRLAAQLPLARPIPNSPITSGYGARMDPFLGRLAMHTGVDFRAPSGYPARATAGGTVITAAYTGGYGNMVEIDHGNGITTRYGHLSEINVVVGQVVAKDAVIGHTGSTGRSTGPHLHYEVRVDGAAIDPITYIKAGKELAPLLAAAS